MPSTHMPTTKGIGSSAARQTEVHSGPCLVRGAQRDSVGGVGRARVVQLLEIQKKEDSKLQQHPFLLENITPPHKISTLL